MIRILRPTGVAGLVSGRAFDDVFARSLAPDPTVEVVELSAFMGSIFGERIEPDDPGVHAAFSAATRSFEFLCPNYGAILLAPLLAYVRNRSGSRVRLLLIAHAPGAYVLEWTLLRPLLLDGDVLVAPTESAARTIEFLIPELAPHVHRVPHPIATVGSPGARRPRHVCSLGRLHPNKLLHRQIEAAALLRERRFSGLTMRIAGPLCEPGQRAPSAYARSLAAKIRRLGLSESVQLVDEITTDEDKRRFLGEARLLLNLSISSEESFGKAIAEALGVGVPVLATSWDGFPETVGAGGRCIPIDATTFGMDVSAERLADAIEAVLNAPPSEDTCRNEARRFDPAIVRRGYREILDDAAARAEDGPSPVPTGEVPATSTDGLLAVTAPLGQCSWAELFDLHVQDAGRLRHGLPGVHHRAATAADELRGLLLQGVRLPLSRLLAGLDLHGTDEATSSTQVAPIGRGLIGKVVAGSMSGATLASRLACLRVLARVGRVDALRRGVDTMVADGLRLVGVRFFEVEALRLDGDHRAAFMASVAEEDPSCWGELAADRVHQLALVCRDWGFPGLALPCLRDWLQRFPDSPESAILHLDRCANAVALGPEFLGEARQALDAARELLDESVDLDGIAAAVRRAEEPPWSVIERELGTIVEVTPVGRSRSTFIVETDVGRRVVKRMPPERNSVRHIEVLARLTHGPTKLGPRPLGVVAGECGWYALLDWVEGAAVSPDTTDEAFWRAAVALLGRLNRCPAPPDWSLEVMWLDRLERSLSDESAAAFLLDGLHRAMPRGPRTLAHGDFSPQNLVWSSDGLILVDWEEFGSAPPGFDAGWLLAHVRLGVEQTRRDLLLTCMGDEGLDSSNLEWFETLGLLRLLHRARTLPMEAGLRQTVLAAVRSAVEVRAETSGWQHWGAGRACSSPS